jgi:hypothetical protein
MPTVWEAPLARAQERVAKKPFGIFITPETSPVQPERFTGYHTGADFELLPGEDAHAVDVHAVCTGPLIIRRAVNGYGGVAIQRCAPDGSPVTVLYGHLNLASIQAQVGDELIAGTRIGTLGEGFSTETDGERPHLHLSIHRGDAVEYRGYVQAQAELAQWIDPVNVLHL